MYTIEDLKKSKFTNLLTSDEEKKFIQEIRKNKNQEIKNKFIKLHRLLVASISAYYNSEKIPDHQIIKAGNKGLEKALDKYKLSYKFRFSVYAAWFIRSEIHKTLNLPKYPEKIK